MGERMKGGAVSEERSPENEAILEYENRKRGQAFSETLHSNERARPSGTMQGEEGKGEDSRFEETGPGTLLCCRQAL